MKISESPCFKVGGWVDKEKLCMVLLILKKYEEKNNKIVLAKKQHFLFILNSIFLSYLA